MKKGLLIIISGPSGVGKGAIRAKIMEKNPLGLYYSVSMTTRKPRLGEVDGVDYFFVSKEKFLETLAEGGLLESNCYVSSYYGTPKAKVEEMRALGHNVLLEIDVNGAEQVLKAVHDPNVVSIFILPPSFPELEKRIRGRCSETEDLIQARLSRAKSEFKLKGNYKYNVINDSLDRCAAEIESIIRKEKESLR